MTESGFRLDIQGLRGLALVLVLATHADIPALSGGFVGLDVFYVLSGFLITGLILHEVQRSGTVSLVRFYARRAKRLLPLAATVLAAVLVASLALLGTTRRLEVAGDVLAAALYLSNWRFIAQSVDYFHFDTGAISPVQHYWSLSVEEQFYLAWPVVILAFLWMARRRGRGVRALLWTVVVPVGIGSFAYSVWFSPVNPEAAYFSTLTRIWEIAVGCALALVLPRAIRLPRGIQSAVVAAGIAVLLWSAFAFDQEMTYPGWQALAPVLASAAVILAGTATAASLPVRALSVAPLQWLGKISYAWYLWHWPALTFAAAALGQLTMSQKIAVTLLSGIPTVATHYLVEERFRHSRRLSRQPRRALAIGFACTATAVVMALSLSSLQPTIATAAGEVPGAEANTREGPRIQKRVDRIRPAPRDVQKDREKPFRRCHIKDDTSRTKSPGSACVFADRDSPTTVVNVGDSHALMISPAVIRLGRQHGWRVVNLTRAGCTMADVRYHARCDEWRENTLQRIVRERPSLVVVSSATDGGSYNPERYAVKDGRGKRLTRARSQPLLERGFARTLRRLRDSTRARIVVIRDITWAPKDFLDCVSDNPRQLDRCAFEPKRSARLAFDARGARRVDGIKLIDPLPALCRPRRCPVVIGDALVYRNRYHLTATFARTLAPWLDSRLPAISPRP
jgi:peptidoglycan/LPS O-acetylase OafA/YrhL